MSWLAKLLAAIFKHKPKPQIWQMTITVSPADADVRLRFDGQEWPAGPGGEPNRLIQFSSDRAKPGVPGVLSVVREGYVSESLNLASIGPPSQHVAVALHRDVPVVQKRHVDGKIFRTADGQPWRWQLSSQFSAVYRWAQGEDLEPLAAWTHAVGSNGWRVFLQWFNYKPGPDKVPYGPDVLSPAQVASFCRWCAERGLYVELTVLTDCQMFGMSHEAQCERVKAILEAVKDLPHVSIELANEPWANGADVDRIATDLNLWDGMNRPVLMSTGNYGIAERGQEATFRALDYVGEHTPRVAHWPAELAKSGHFVYDGWPAGNHESGQPYPGWKGFKGQNVAIIADEPIGADETSQPGRRDADPNNWADAGAGSAIGLAGMSFHSQDGLIAVVPGPTQTECARRCFEAAAVFPGDAFLGQYTHNETFTMPLEPAKDVSEVVGYTSGNRSYCVATQPGESYQAVAQNGWHIMSTDGWRGNYVYLEK